MNTTASIDQSQRAKPLVWVVILNWNGLDDTLAYLDSLSRIESSACNVHILVIDNASQIDPTEAISHRFPQVQTLRMDTNLGFAAGCNYGMQLAQAAQADYVLLLNNDTIVAPSFLDELVTYSRTHPLVGIVAPVICYADDPETVWFAGARAILPLGYFEHRYLGRSRATLPTQPFATDYASGCCMLIPCSLLDHVGMFDEQFFAYFEDADLCLRVVRAGYRIVCVPTSVIWHKESASTRQHLQEGTTSPLKHYLCTRNRIITVMKNASLVDRVCFLVVGNTSITCFFLIAFTIRRRWTKVVWFCRGVVHGFQRVLQLQDYNHAL